MLRYSFLEPAVRLDAASLVCECLLSQFHNNPARPRGLVLDEKWAERIAVTSFLDS